MQTKKRAKAVKFGTNENKKEQEEEVVEKAEKVETKDDSTEKTAENDDSHDKGFEAHFSSIVETLDITEVDPPKSDEDEPEVIADQAKVEDVPTESEVDEPADTVVEENTDEVENKEDVEGTEPQPEKETVLNKDATFFNVPPDEYDNKKSTKPYFFTVIIVTFLLGLAFFAGIYTMKNNGFKFPAIATKPTDTPKVIPTTLPSPKPVDLSKYSIEILNGSGVAGEAAKLKTDLTTAGFKVIKTGNADTSNYVKTEIVASKNVQKEYLDKLKEIVAKSYILGVVKSVSSGSAEVTVTIGSSSAK